MRAVVDRLQGPAPEPPGRVALGGRLRPGTGPARRGAAVPDVAQPLAGISGPEGDQFQTPDVTGQSTYSTPARPRLCSVTSIYTFGSLSLTHSIHFLVIDFFFLEKPCHNNTASWPWSARSLAFL